MVSESDMGRCVNEEVELRRRVNTRQCVIKDAGPKGGGLGGPTSIGEGFHTLWGPNILNGTPPGIWLSYHL